MSSSEDGDEENMNFVLHDAAERGDTHLLHQLLGINSTEHADAEENLLVDLEHQLMIKEMLVAVDGNGATSLHVAIMNGNVDCAAALLKRGASASRSCDGNPPLHMAVNLGLHAGREEDAHALVVLLLTHGADPLSRDYWGRTALHWTGVADLAETFNALLQAADSAMQRSVAAMHPSGGSSAGGNDGPGSLEGTSILETQDHDGNTVLHLAVRFGAINIVQLSCNAQPFMQQAAAPSPPPPTAAAAPSHTEPADTVMGGTEPSLSDHQASAGLPTPTAGVSTPVAAAEQHMDAAGELSTAAGRVDGLVDAAPTRPVPADVGSGGGSSTGAEGGCKATESEQQRSARRLALQAQLCSRLCKSRNKEHQTPLHVAGIFGKTEAAAIIARAAPECVSLGDRRRRTAGGLAKMRGHTALSKALSIASISAAPVTNSTANASIAAQVPAASLEAVSKAVAIVAPPECLWHRTAPEPITRAGAAPPPENINRLHVLTKEGSGILLTKEFSHNSSVHWSSTPVPSAPLSDVLAVHDWAYIKGIQDTCSRIPDNVTSLGHLDGDTAIGRHSFTAALKAAGAVISGVDTVLRGQASTVFCAVRPPGHHAGPQGACVNANDPHGSHGFCLLSNIAIGAAYAMNVYRHAGIKRVAILDFDVHHGNGTQAVVMNTVPHTQRVPFETPFGAGAMNFPTYKPWLGVDDASNIFFASVQGYGHRTPSSSHWFYPGSGATADSAPAPSHATTQQSTSAINPEASAAGVSGGSSGNGVTGSSQEAADSKLLPEDPDGEFAGSFDTLISGGPRVINVGIGGPGVKSKAWRRAWRDKILPALVNFKPDMLFVSAGFDAHRKEDLNLRYIGVTETDYEWLTGQLVDVAARCCSGRLVSVLEGGYNLRGGVSSVFARSTAAHVRALAAGPPSGPSGYDHTEAESERKAERKKAEKAAAAAAAGSAGLGLSAMLGPSLVAAAAALFGPASKTAAAPSTAAAAAPAATAVATQVSVPVNYGIGSAASAAGEAVATPAAAVAVAADEEPSGKRRRRGGPVDYAALNAQLEAEAAATTAATK